jgi:hypothetical protein
MIRIDLDDLPPRLGRALAALTDTEEVVLVRGGAVVAWLSAEVAAKAPAAPVGEAEMAEVMEHFGSIIEDEF